MEPYVICITRQFAAMGRSVAKIVSEDLGIEFYDRDLVEEVAKRLNVDIGLVSTEEETVHKGALPLGFGSNLQDDIFAVQKSIIQDLGKKEPCILVGRLADSILAQHPNHLSVYIYASKEQRIQNGIQLLGMTPEISKKNVQKVDAARERYRKKYAPNQKEVFSDKHLLVDSGHFGVEGTAQLIKQVAVQKFGIES